MDQGKKQEKELRTAMKAAEKVVDLLRGPGAFDEMEEEQTLGLEALIALNEKLGQDRVIEWLYNKEWEEALVPMRLPKGMSDELKLMDEARMEMVAREHCEGCKTKEGCVLLSRNPSEVLLTTALKLAFAKVNVEKYGAQHKEPL